MTHIMTVWTNLTNHEQNLSKWCSNVFLHPMDSRGCRQSTHSKVPRWWEMWCLSWIAHATGTNPGHTGDSKNSLATRTVMDVHTISRNKTNMCNHVQHIATAEWKFWRVFFSGWMQKIKTVADFLLVLAIWPTTNHPLQLANETLQFRHAARFCFMLEFVCFGWRKKTKVEMINSMLRVNHTALMFIA